MKVFGDQTMSDIWPLQNMPNFTGENGHLSIANKLIFIDVYYSFVEHFTHHCHNFMAEKEILKNQICSVSLQWSKY